MSTSSLHELPALLARPRVLWSLVVVLCAVHAGLAWSARSPGVQPGGDQAKYLLLGQALQDLSYADRYLHDAPPHRLYPPAYPAALAAWTTIFGPGYDGLVLLTILFSVAALIITFDLVRRISGPELPLLVLAVLAVNPLLIEYVSRTASEAPYAFFSLLAIYLAVRVSRGSRIGTGATAVIAGLTRVIGVAALGAVGLHWLLTRRYRPLIVLTVIGGVTVGAWIVYSALAPNHYVGASYGADFLSGTSANTAEHQPGIVGRLVGRVTENVPAYLSRSIPWSVAAPTVAGTPIDNLLVTLLLSGALAVGLWVLWHRWRPAALYLLLYGAILVVWPWRLNRFLVPVLPLIVSAIFLGLDAAVRRYRFGWRWPALSVLALMLIGSGAVRSSGEIGRWSGCDRSADQLTEACVGPEYAGYLEVIGEVGELTPPDAVLYTSQPHLLYYATRRRGTLREAGLAETPETFPTFLSRTGVGFVLLGSVHPIEMARVPALLRPLCDRLRIVTARPPYTYLFAVASDSIEQSPACAALAVHAEANEGRDLQRL